MTNRLRLFTPLFSFFLLFGCINVPEVVDPPPDGGGDRPDGGGADGGETPAQDFELAVAPQEETVPQGGAKSFQVTVVRKNGFQGAVTVILVSPPTGVSAPAVAIPAAETTGTLNVSVAANTPPLSLTLTVRGTAGTIQRTRSVVLNVVPQGSLVVSWVAPSESRSVVNGPVSTEVSVEGGQAEQVELLRGETVIHTWTAPPYKYQWNTGDGPEGEFALKARATRGGSAYLSAERTVVVDRTAPRIESRQPVSGATQVSVRTAIQVRFSEPVRASSVTAANVGLEGNGGAGIPATVELSADGRTLTVAPANVLPTSTTVTVKLGASGSPIVDIAGNALVADGTWSFAVPYWLQLGEAISAYPGNTPTESAVMRMGGDGMPIIAWSESDGISKAIHVARWSGTEWSALGGAIHAQSEPGTHAQSPSLAIDTSGRILLAWDEGAEEANRRIVHAAKWTGKTWQELPAPPLPNRDLTMTMGSHLVIKPDGSTILYAAVFDIGVTTEAAGCSLAANETEWRSLNVSPPPIQVNRGPSALITSGNDVLGAFDAFIHDIEARAVTVSRNHEQQLGGPLIYSPTDSAAYNASLAANGTGDPLVAWEEHRGPADVSNIYFSQWQNNSWQSPTLVTLHTTNNRSPSLALGADGVPTVAWSGFSTPAQAIFVARRTGSDWQLMGPALSANSETDTPGANPVLRIDSEGRPVVAWIEKTPSGTHIFVARQNR